MKTLLLRVGIDKGCGGCLAPIFKDGSFEYVPIPEERATSEDRVFGNLCGRHTRSLVNFLPKRLHNKAPHFDPEFETFTYGDPTPTKSRQLVRLVPGDLLVFYAGLEPEDRGDRGRLYIIGYFTITKVYEFNNIPKSDHQPLFHRLRNNAHIKMKNLDDGLVVSEGEPSGSILLSKPLPLGDSRDCVLRDMWPIVGYRGSILRAVGHWVSNGHVQMLKSYLDSGIPRLVENGNRLFSYVLRSDTGFAPNVTGGYCTLACCKPKIRSTANAGDWVIGTLPKHLGKNRLAYVMRINESLTFNDYFEDKRFQIKKPDLDLNGDNIYYKKKGKFVQVKNNHHTGKHLDHDTSADRVLIGSIFWYFGEKAPEIPSRLCSLIKTGPGHKIERDASVIRELVSWISSEYRPGVHGNPRTCAQLQK